LNISKDQPAKFTFGTIIKNADDLSQDFEYTFLVFKVGIGKSYSYKMSQGENYEQIKLKDGFDSMYLENDSSS
jgi:hypothetical protein